MGCFSFICKECGKPVNSTSFKGEGVKLFLLKNGKPIEEMQGNYDSYGRVFDNFNNKDSSSKEWKMEWSDVCSLIFSSNRGNGISAIHTDCWKGKVPVEKSEDDENQGWGKLKKKETKEIYHKVY